MTTLFNPKISLATAVDAVAGRLKATIRDALNLAPSVGTNAGQINFAVAPQVVAVTSGAPLTIDLTAAVDVGNGVVALAHVVGYLFRNNSAVAGQNFTLGGGANPVHAADVVAIPPGGFVFRWVDGMLPVAGGTKNLQIAVAAGAAVPGTLTLYGR
jgi:hypothetical protein